MPTKTSISRPAVPRASVIPARTALMASAWGEPVLLPEKSARRFAANSVERHQRYRGGKR